MNAIETYKLIYQPGMRPSPQHVLEREKVRSLERALDTTTSARAAQFLLDAIAFRRDNADRISRLTTGKQSIEATRLRDDITHIHKKCEEEIRERFVTPPMTAEEFAEVMFQEQIKDEIEKVVEESGGKLSK